MDGSLIAMRTTACFGDTELAVGTSFVYLLDGECWLVTAWHMVSGMNNVTRAPLSNHGGRPDRFILQVPVFPDIGPDAQGHRQYSWVPLEFPLYEDVDRRQPVFRWHPVDHEAVDVVAMPWREGVASDSIPHMSLRPANYDERRLRLRVPMDGYVVGFPRGLGGAGHLPIWKRASIASEPDVPLLNRSLPPMFYVDCATREGASGAPFLASHTGLLANELFESGREPAEALFAGTATTFAGIYSGRVMGEDELAAQLGIIWTEFALMAIIRGGCVADSLF